MENYKVTKKLLLNENNCKEWFAHAIYSSRRWQQQHSPLPYYVSTNPKDFLFRLHENHTHTHMANASSCTIEDCSLFVVKCLVSLWYYPKTLIKETSLKTTHLMAVIYNTGTFSWPTAFFFFNELKPPPPPSSAPLPRQAASHGSLRVMGKWQWRDNDVHFTGDTIQ